jgi:hypothetical protein
MNHYLETAASIVNDFATVALVTETGGLTGAIRSTDYSLSFASDEKETLFETALAEGAKLRASEFVYNRLNGVEAETLIPVIRRHFLDCLIRLDGIGGGSFGEVFDGIGRPTELADIRREFSFG